MLWALGLGGLYGAWKMRASRNAAAEKRKNPDHVTVFDKRAFDTILDKQAEGMETIINPTLPESEKRRLLAEHRSYGLQQAQVEHSSVLRSASRQMASSASVRSPYA
jgi:hypothetical protein